MELHKVPRGSRIKVKSDIKVPPGAPEIQEEQILIFNNIDGMYSHDEFFHLLKNQYQ